MSSSLMPSRCLTRARRLLPCAAIRTVWPAAMSGTTDALPVGQEALDDVLEALGARHLLAQVGVARVARLRPLVVVLDRRWRYVEAAPPGHELLLAVLLEGLLLVLALQSAVVPLVEPPRAPDRDPVTLGHVEGEVGRGDGAPQQRGVHDVGEQVVLDELLAAADRLVAALVAERDVDPAREQVARVPLALAVAEQDQGAARFAHAGGIRESASSTGSPGRSRSTGSRERRWAH